MRCCGATCQLPSAPPPAAHWPTSCLLPLTPWAPRELGPAAPGSPHSRAVSQSHAPGQGKSPVGLRRGFAKAARAVALDLGWRK